MGKRSDLSIPQRREVVLMLLRREEPAAKPPWQMVRVEPIPAIVRFGN